MIKHTGVHVITAEVYQWALLFRGLKFPLLTYVISWCLSSALLTGQWNACIDSMGLAAGPCLNLNLTYHWHIQGLVYYCLFVTSLDWLSWCQGQSTCAVHRTAVVVTQNLLIVKLKTKIPLLLNHFPIRFIVPIQHYCIHLFLQQVIFIPLSWGSVYTWHIISVNSLKLGNSRTCIIRKWRVWLSNMFFQDVIVAGAKVIIFSFNNTIYSNKLLLKKLYLIGTWK